MDLALLVYAISILKPLNVTFSLLAMLTTVVLGIVIIVNSTDDLLPKTFTSIRRWCLSIFVVSGIGVVFIPSERTAYMMVGAYTAQRIATDPVVARLNDKVVKLIENKIDSYANELTAKQK